MLPFFGDLKKKKEWPLLEKKKKIFKGPVEHVMKVQALTLGDKNAMM